MKIYKSIVLAFVAAAGIVSFTACNDDYDYDSELSKAEIGDTFTVKNIYGTIYTGKIDGDKITVLVNPFKDVKAELAEAYPTFYLPMGATCSPSPAEPQDFSKEVKYTITSGDGKNSRTYTVNYGPSTPLETGINHTASVVLAEKIFPELGYPGTYGNYNLSPEKYGDLLLSIGFCGENLVGFSQVYAWGAGSTPANAAQAIKIWNVNTLAPVDATLNLGSLTVDKIVNVTNDSKGHLVAATGGINGAQSDVYYWTSIDAAPVKVGTLPKPVYTASGSADPSMFISVAGDITADAAISYMPTKTVDGQHVVAYVRGGAITNSATITTGYSALESSQWQMISLYDPTEDSNYLVGFTFGAEINNSVFANYKSATGTNLGTMGMYMNTKNFTDGVTAWISAGNKLARPGGRRPFMMAMTFNGTRYSMCLNGYDWDNFNMFMDEAMTMMYYPNALTHDLRKYTYEVNNGANGIAAAWSFGSCGCWYWDDEQNLGYVAIWQGREGMSTFRVTSYE